jgi:hypothetical protein
MMGIDDFGSELEYCTVNISMIGLPAFFCCCIDAYSTTKHNMPSDKSPDPLVLQSSKEQQCWSNREQ